MVKNELNAIYFNWVYQLVCDYSYHKKLSYRKLFTRLASIDFTYSIYRDGNRAKDGINLRYRFGYEQGYQDSEVAEYLDGSPCSVLEMMVALAKRCEEQIMDDPDYGNRTGQWFWNMIISLGLGSMSDSKFDDDYVNDVIFRLLNREYQPNGEGGLFTLTRPRRDLRTVEIWYQMSWYLDEILSY